MYLVVGVWDDRVLTVHSNSKSAIVLCRLFDSSVRPKQVIVIYDNKVIEYFIEGKDYGLPQGF